MNQPDPNKGRFKAIEHLTDREVLERALELGTLSAEQRAAFTSMRDALQTDPALALTPRQRAWVEGRLRTVGAIALTSLHTILADLDRIGAKK